ncbi:MAG: hypothetical protein V4543_16645 [Bacteroidota bacterium]
MTATSAGNTWFRKFENWLSRGNSALKIGLIAVLVSVVYSVPRLNVPFNDFYAKNIAHPLTPQPGLNPAEHYAKRAFRITAPGIAHTFGLNTTGAFALEIITAYLLLIALAFTVFRITKDALATLIVTLAFTFSYVHQGAVLTNHVQGWEGYGFFFLALSLLLRNSPLLPLAALPAFFSDERTFIGFAFIIAWNLSDAWKSRRILTLPVIIPFVCIGAAFLIRKYLTAAFGLSLPVGSDNGVGMAIFKANLMYMPMAVFCSLKSFVFVLLFGTYYMYRNGLKLPALAFGLAVFGSFCAGMIVHDISKSAAYVFTAILPALGYVYNNLKRSDFIKAASLGLALNILLPTYMIIMSGITRIFYVPPTWLTIYLSLKGE